MGSVTCPQLKLKEEKTSRFIVCKTIRKPSGTRTVSIFNNNLKIYLSKYTYGLCDYIDFHFTKIPYTKTCKCHTKIKSLNFTRMIDVFVLLYNIGIQNRNQNFYFS